MQTTVFVIVALAMAITASTVSALVSRRHCRRLLGERCARLEESLRVYSNANASIGRHVTVLEGDLRDLRERLAEMEQGASPVRAPEPAGPTTAAREAFTDAEQRLSLLIRSRLGELRPG